MESRHLVSYNFSAHRFHTDFIPILDRFQSRAGVSPSTRLGVATVHLVERFFSTREKWCLTGRCG